MPFVFKRLVLSLSIAVAFAADKDSAPFRPAAADSYEHHQTNSKVTIGVDPYTTPDKQKAAFGKLDLYSRGVLPVLVVIRNDGDKAIRLAPASRRFMSATQNHLGYLPAATARWAASPHLLEGFGKLSVIFEDGTLDPIAREVVVMTIATRNGCHVCVAMHTSAADRAGGAAGRHLGAAVRLASGRRAAGRDPGVHAAGPRHRGRRGRRRAAGLPGRRLHQAERPGGGARDRHLHDVHPGQPAHRRTGGRPAQRVRLADVEDAEAQGDAECRR